MIKPKNVILDFDDFCDDCEISELENDVTYNNNVPTYHIECMHRGICETFVGFYKSKMKEDK